MAVENGAASPAFGHAAMLLPASNPMGHQNGGFFG